MSTIPQTVTQSKSLDVLQALARKHRMILNACHGCGKEAGIHKKMNKDTLLETTFTVNLFNCHHKMKICNSCLEQGLDIRKPKFSKAQKKEFKKIKVRELKAERKERPSLETAMPPESDKSFPPLGL